MRVRLVLCEDGFLTRRVSFQKHLLIGRDEVCDLRISEPNISRRHCLLLVHESRVLCIDLVSSNGTEVNQSQLEPGQPATLAHDDRLSLGGVELRVMIHDGVAHESEVGGETSRQDETSIVRSDGQRRRKGDGLKGDAIRDRSKSDG
ncbi:MAG: FHA domain-containing protein [Planctomycetota bacterium]